MTDNISNQNIHLQYWFAHLYKRVYPYLETATEQEKIEILTCIRKISSLIGMRDPLEKDATAGS